MGAGHLKVGDKIKQSDGTFGEVKYVNTIQEARTMYNLEVEEAHTFFVGTQGWLVHNCGPISVEAVAQNIRTTLRLESNNRSIAYADIYIEGIEGRIIGVSGTADYGATLAKRLGAKFAGIPSTKGPNMLDGERKILEELRSQLSPDSRGTINLFLDPSKVAVKNANGIPVGGACQSCTDAIMHFRSDFPGIKLNVTAGW